MLHAFLGQIRGDEMHRIGQLECALADSFQLQSLRGRKIDLKDLQALREAGTSQRETVETRADEDILRDSVGDRLFQGIFGISTASDDVCIGATAQQRFIDDGLGRGQRLFACIDGHARQRAFAKQVARRIGHQTIAPAVIDQGVRIQPRMRRPHQGRG